MSKYRLDAKGKHCRFPRWEGGTIVPCGKPGYPYCETHAAEVSAKREARDRHRWEFANRLVDEAAADLHRGVASVLRGLP